MKVFETVAGIREFVAEARRQGKRIGFVPTMGALHDGHLTLMREAQKDCDVVIASIFVNPTQFGPNEDYAAYPRTWQQDLALCESVGVAAVLHPSREEMYPEGWGTWVEADSLTNVLCGRSRPGHFRGVTTIVTKLFNIVQPDRAYFGQKDAQQVVVLMKMVRDLNMPVEIVVVPIVRDADGLAKSSRNTYLSPEEKNAALVLQQALRKAEALAGQGETSVSALRQIAVDTIASEKLANIDYVEIYSFPGLQVIDELNQRALLAVAVKFGATRLIDNTILEPARQ